MFKKVLEPRKNSFDGASAKNTETLSPDATNNDGSVQKLLSPNLSGLDNSTEHKKNHIIPPIRELRNSKRASTVFPLDGFQRNQNIKPSNFANKNQKSSENSNAVADDNLTGQTQNDTKIKFKKSSTSKRESSAVTRAKSIRRPVQPKFNPDSYEEGYETNELIRKVERVNKKRMTMIIGLPPRDSVARKRSVSSSLSSSSSSPSSSADSPNSDQDIETSRQLKQKSSSNRSSANKKDAISQSDQPKTANRVSFSNQLEMPNRGSFSKELQIQNRGSSAKENQRVHLNPEIKEEDREGMFQMHTAAKEDREESLKEQIQANPDFYQSNGYAHEDHEDHEDQEDQDENYSRYFQPVRMLTRDKRNWRLRKDPEYRHIKWMFFPDDPFRMAWDLIIILILLYTTWTLPLRTAGFIDDSAVGWTISDWILNAFFIGDIFINFFSAFFDSDLNLVTSRKKIIKNYLFGWLFIDICATIPFDLMFGNSNSYQQLLRVSRISRLYKLLKLFKVTRILKLVREKTVILKYIQKVLHLTPQVERLFVSFFLIIIFVHLSACSWKFLLDFFVDQPNNWLKVYGFYDQEGNPIATEAEIYIASAYLIVQTIVTVGYGDLPATTDDERIACTFWMFIGVFVYSFVIGSLASLVSTFDTQNAQYSNKMNTLIQLKKEYNFDNTLYLKIKNALKYGTRQQQDNQDFLKQLPQHLRQDLSCIIYQDILKSVPFFADKPKSFITTIAPLLRPIKVNKGDKVYLQGDPADEMFFIKSGEVAYVIPKYFNFKFLKIKEGYYFGEADLLFYGEIRKYTLKAVKTSELYVLNKKDFKQIFFMEFRNIGMEVISNALKRKIRTRKAYKESVTFLSKSTEQGPHTETKRLEHKTTAYNEDLIDDDPDEEDLNTDSEEEAEKTRTSQLFPGLNLAQQHAQENATSLGKIEEAEEEFSPIATLPRAKASRLSKFFEPTAFGGLNVLSETIPAVALLGKTLKLEDNKEPEVKEINQKVDKIQDKLNNLLSMSQKLEEGLKSFSGVSKRNESKSHTFKASLILEDKPKNMKQRKSAIYSTHGDLLEHFTKSSKDSQRPSSAVRNWKSRKGTANRSSKKSSKNNSQIMNSSTDGAAAKENDKNQEEPQKPSGYKIEITKAGGDGWETISENEKD